MSDLWAQSATRAQLFAWVKRQAQIAKTLKLELIVTGIMLGETQAALKEALGGNWKVPMGKECLIVPHDRVVSFTDETSGSRDRGLERRCRLELLAGEINLDPLWTAIAERYGRRDPIWLNYRGIAWKVDAMDRDCGDRLGATIAMINHHVITLHLTAFGGKMA